MHIYATDNLVDVLDRVLDKGIVVDPWVRVTRHGIEVAPSLSRLRVASTELHNSYGQSVPRR